MRHHKSRLIVLLISLIAVFILLLVRSELPRFLPEKTRQVFSKLDRNEIREIKITGEKTTHLYRKSGNWYTKKDNAEFRADSARVTRIIEGFISLRKENIVSNNKNRHQDLGINKRKIEVTAGEKSYVIYIGNTEGLSNNYVRINSENEIFIADGFDEIFISEDYRDLSLHLVSSENRVSEVKIDSNNNYIQLTKNKDEWRINERIAKKDRVDFYLNDLKTLKAQDIFKKRENYSVINPDLNITLKENNKQKTISFYYENEGSYLTSVSNSKYDYLVPAAYVASLKKEEKDFIE